MPARIRSPAREAKSEITYPQRAESELKAIENKRLKELQKAVREAMPEILAIAAQEQSADLTLRQDGYSDIIRRIRNRFRLIKDSFERAASADLLERELKGCADYTDKRQLKEWQRAVRSTFGIDIRKDFFIGEQYETMLSRWTQNNVSYIKSIESSCFDEMENAVVEAFLKGKTNRELSAEIQRRFDVSKSKANLLARDQIGTLNADLSRKRQEAAGVEEYIWRTCKDAAVRECHAELDGKKFRYDNPPEMWYMTKRGKVYTGRRCNPGEDYQCRCTASPVFKFQKLNAQAFKEMKR